MIDLRYFDDVRVHEGGVAEPFPSERGELLPAGDLELADEWLYTDRSVSELVAVDGARMELRDVERGQRITVANAVDVAAGPCALCVGRPLPVGRAYRSFAGLVPLVPELVDDMLEAIIDRDPLGPRAEPDAGRCRERASKASWWHGDHADDVHAR
ncbi:MAG: hypothetical protein S0880_21320 [Actinomycetota bacterium]|nr:hypothetical protein [Actinomycetota bacterium]